ncbi:MAG: zinc metallopeptidase [Lachnospiraceae bacterium]|nr:zinc metallopeptidase [Lachnospiraceae bacterium]
MHTILLYGGYGGYGLYFDWTYILIILGAILCFIASAVMNNTASKYMKVASSSGITGEQAAERILSAAGIYDVQVNAISGNLTDHYDPRTKVVNLAEESYGKTSLTGIGVAAHECGHAIQDAQGYAPLKFRSAMVPVVNIGANFSWPIFFIGLIFQMDVLTELGILLFSLAVLFQLVTLPVEIDASHRALKMLESTGLMREDEVKDTRKVLSAAAMTYVAALASSLLQLLRLIILAGGNRRND